MSYYNIVYTKYTPKTHPWRGQAFIGWPPGVYRLDNKPYCPTAWILSKDGKTQAVQNTKKDCMDLAKSWGATIKWQPKQSPTK